MFLRRLLSPPPTTLTGLESRRRLATAGLFLLAAALVGAGVRRALGTLAVHVSHSASLGTEEHVPTFGSHDSIVHHLPSRHLFVPLHCRYLLHLSDVVHLFASSHVAPFLCCL